jgi:hypothetical protein
MRTIWSDGSLGVGLRPQLMDIEAQVKGFSGRLQAPAR